MGGYGLYQAYRRLVRTELTREGAEYLILYIWGDDHLRSLLRCRHALIYPWWNSQGGRLFHGNFWAHLEMDLDTGSLAELPNLLSTPESLYQMTDPDYMVSALQDDWMLQIAAYLDGFIRTIDRRNLNCLADILRCPAIPAGDPDLARQRLTMLCNTYAFKATKYILDRVTEFTARHGKKLLIVLFDPQVTRELITTGSRYDQPIVQDLEMRGLPIFDMNLVHVADYQCFRLSLDDYFKRYFIGHYNPSGNHFFAFSIKQKLVEWLDPKPPTYRQEMSVFPGYLPREEG